MVETLPLSVESTLTDRYQTTIPDTVRKALNLEKKDKISYAIQADGRVLIARSDQQQDDPVLEKFLHFLALDMSHRPQHVQAVNADLLSRAQALIEDMEVDLDAPLSDKDE
ncbi:MAG: type II toxin-antitoxin system PrlF family antitoxin [Methylococcaceae bacterium]